jgi:hypothetical protein
MYHLALNLSRGTLPAKTEGQPTHDGPLTTRRGATSGRWYDTRSKHKRRRNGIMLQTAARLDQLAAIQSTTRSPIMITVAWAPPDLGMRGITDASATHSP